jgi:hypothetical protein
VTVTAGRTCAIADARVIGIAGVIGAGGTLARLWVGGLVVLWVLAWLPFHQGSPSR